MNLLTNPLIIPTIRPVMQPIVVVNTVKNDRLENATETFELIAIVFCCWTFFLVVRELWDWIKHRRRGSHS